MTQPYRHYTHSPLADRIADLYLEGRSVAYVCKEVEMTPDELHSFATRHGIARERAPYRLPRHWPANYSDHNLTVDNGW